MPPENLCMFSCMLSFFFHQVWLVYVCIGLRMCENGYVIGDHHNMDSLVV